MNRLETGSTVLVSRR